MKSDIQYLVEISNKIGIKTSYVQGGGGNTSVKIKNNLMAIKASGCSLKNMNSRSGFTFVNYNEICKIIKNKKILKFSENDLDNYIKNKVIKVDGYINSKPSIETGFHALLPYKFIVHTHSVYSNILCCSNEGERITKKIFPKSTWVKYANPGKNITIELSKSLGNIDSKIIFMQNHGIIVANNDPMNILEQHDLINQKIINYFNLDEEYHEENKVLNTENLKDKVIFPDQIVYLSQDRLKNSLAGKETISAYNYIIKNIYSLGLTPNFIDLADISYIENMESEKYRKSLIKK